MAKPLLILFILCGLVSRAGAEETSVQSIFPASGGRTYVVLMVKDAGGFEYPAILRVDAQGKLDPTFGEGGAIRYRGKFGADKIGIFDVKETKNGELFIGGSSIAEAVQPDHFVRPKETDWLGPLLRDGLKLDKLQRAVGELVADVREGERPTATRELFLAKYGSDGKPAANFGQQGIVQRKCGLTEKGETLGFRYDNGKTQPLLLTQDKNGRTLVIHGSNGTEAKTDKYPNAFFQKAAGMAPTHKTEGEWRVHAVGFEGKDVRFLASSVQEEPGDGPFGEPQQKAERVAVVDGSGKKIFGLSLRNTRNDFSIVPRVAHAALSPDAKTLYVLTENGNETTVRLRSYDLTGKERGPTAPLVDLGLAQGMDKSWTGLAMEPDGEVRVVGIGKKDGALTQRQFDPKLQNWNTHSGLLLTLPNSDICTRSMAEAFGK